MQDFSPFKKSGRPTRGEMIDSKLSRKVPAWLIIIIGVGAFCLACIVVFIANYGTIKPDTVDVFPSEITAWYSAKELIKKRMLNPDDATFNNLDRTVVSDYEFATQNPDYGSFKVSSWMTSKNAFGVTVRKRFTCRVWCGAENYNGERTWSLDDLQFH